MTAHTATVICYSRMMTHLNTECFVNLKSFKYLSKFHSPLRHHHQSSHVWFKSSRKCFQKKNRKGKTEALPHDNFTEPPESLKSQEILKSVKTVAVASLLSKILGLVRETALAAAFGVGPVMVAFSYSSLIPSFFISLLGGVNGPFQSAMATVLSQTPLDERPALLLRVSFITALFFSLLSLALFLLSSPLLNLTAPGIHGETRQLAVMQLKVMSPCVLLSALTGLGFGLLSSGGQFFIPSMAPSLSSLSVLAALALLFTRSGPSPSLYSGALALGLSITGGAFCQCLLQWWAQSTLPRASLSSNFAPTTSLSALFDSPWAWGPQVGQVFSLLVPASLSVGLLQVATATDLYFASFIPQAAAAMTYANLLAMAPIGILSTSLLTPMLPLFASLSKPSDRQLLKHKIREAFLLATCATLLLASVAVPLCPTLVQLVFQRRAFESEASKLVSSLLACYLVGSPLYLLRDVAVRVYYALGDGTFPFVVSVFAILLNIVLDWALCLKWGLGANGLIWATAFVNGLSAFLLIVRLQFKLKGLDSRTYLTPLLTLIVASSAAFCFSSSSFKVLNGGFAGIHFLRLWFKHTLLLGLSALAGGIAFAFVILSSKQLELFKV